MSQKAFEYGPAKMTASMSRKSRFPAFLGILSAMVRGGRGKTTRRTNLAGAVAVPRGVGPVQLQTVATSGVDARLLR